MTALVAAWGGGLGFASSTAVTPPVFTHLDLGSLAGPDGSSAAMAVSDAGEVVGYSETPGGETHAFSWTEDGGMVDLGTLPGGEISTAAGVNDSGQIVGYGTQDASVSMPPSVPFLYVNGQLTALPTLGGDEGAAMGINASGWIAGYTANAAGRLRATLWRNGVPTDLGTLPGGQSSQAFAISDDGVVVGAAGTPSGQMRAFRWTQAGGMVDLGTLPGGTFSLARGVSEAGVVVGWSSVDGGESGLTHAFRWSQEEGMVDLGATLGGDDRGATGVDSGGRVVGYSETTPGERFQYRAFTWTEDEGTVDLGPFPACDGCSALAEAINERGWIVGSSDDGAGVSHAALWRFSTPLAIGAVDALTPSVQRYGRFEAAITLDRTFANPFDPDEIAVDVTFTAPSGRQQVVPAFWYQPFTATGTSWEEYAPSGPAGWRVRFAPSEAGQYSYRVDARSATGAAEPVIGSFTVAASTSKGFVRVDDRNGRYLRFDNGDPYVPVGHNVAFEDGTPNLNGVGYYTAHFESLGRAGQNWSRVWMTDFNRSALEWGAGHYSGFYAGPGRYALPSAWRLDRILELAEANGIHVQLVLADHGQFSNRGSDRWGVRCHNPPCEYGEPGYDPGNALSAANGGPVPTDRPDLAFSDAQARDLMKQRLRYVVARWGAFRSVMAWELMNELAFVGTDGNNPFNDAQLRADLVDWHADLAAYLKAVDPHDHLVTTSQAIDETAGAGLQELNAVWAIPAIDVVQIHAYEPPGALVTRVRDMIAQFQASYGKPVLVGEIGLPAPNPEAGFDPATFGGSEADRDHLLQGTFLHNAMWATAVAESMSGYWWWGGYIAVDPSRNRTTGFPLDERLVPPLLGYLQGEDRAPLGLSAVAVTTTGPVVAVGSASADRAYVWVRDADNEYGTGARPGDLAGRTVSGAAVTIPGLADGAYRVRVYDTWGAAGVTDTFTAATASGSLTIQLPDFQRDVALKVDPAAGPVDSDGDGVEDAIDTGAGTFGDGQAFGRIAVLPPGVTVLVQDITPGGVTITVFGTGSAPAKFETCGLPGTLDLLPGAVLDLTCSSAVLQVLEGVARYDLGPGVVVVPEGATARISDLGGGAFRVDQVSGAAPVPVRVTVDGIATEVANGQSATFRGWDFTGFDPPVTNSPPGSMVLNQATAGQAVALKWRLTTSAGAPVTTLASVSLSVQAISCSQGSPLAPPVQVAPGGASLQNKGGGRYQVDWKTDRSWAGTCRRMVLRLADDAVAHDAYFRFR